MAKPRHLGNLEGPRDGLRELLSFAKKQHNSMTIHRVFIPTPSLFGIIPKLEDEQLSCQNNSFHWRWNN